jgi:hypothetical protein
MQQRYCRRACLLCADATAVVEVWLNLTMLVAHIASVLRVVHVARDAKTVVSQWCFQLAIALDLLVAQLRVEGVCAEQTVDL